MSLAQARKNSREQQAAHLVIEALAGTGKTTTLIEGLKLVKGLGTSFVPSDQQAAIWEALQEGVKPRFVCFVAFNRSIAAELKQRVPSGVDAKTMHGLGCGVCFKTYDLKKGDDKVNQYKVYDLIEKFVGRPRKDIDPTIVSATNRLVSLSKMNLLDWGSDDFADDLDLVCSRFDIETNGQKKTIYSLCRKILERCADPELDGDIDFDDMIWLPVQNQLRVFQFDLLLVDEAQDLNRCQQALARMAGKRIVLCGDANQAIYGFAGADSDSLPRMREELGATERGVEVLPLTVTRRCSRAVVAEARKIVPGFEAHPLNAEGSVSIASFDPESANDYRKTVEPGDMLICRCNAPLVSECFGFILQGVKAKILGRDIGKNLQKLLSRLSKGNATTVAEMIPNLEKWKEREIAKEMAKKHPSEYRQLAIEDKSNCLLCLSEGCDTVGEISDKISQIFTDDDKHPGVLLSSGHKSKGLESRRVFFLMPEGAPCPHPMAKQPWEVQQEWNLRYVITTRAIEELVIVG